MALPSSAAERKRVKVYELRENDWFDRGTGFCATQSIQDDATIFVESEEEPDRTLLVVKIKKEDAFQKQQDTLIVWTDPEGIDMALSFQEADGCSSVWNSINAVQQHSSDDLDDLTPGPLTLPTPELGNLPLVEDVMQRASSTQIGRDSMSKMIVCENYIANLIPLVTIAEDLEDLPDLHRLCNIMKTLILFNDTQIIEHVVRDEIILGVVGALEYDPDFPRHKANHRQYLSDESKFKEVVPIQDPDIRRKIHFTYRLQYLKDVVLARILDDPTFSVLNSLIFFHQVDIVQHIQGNTAYLKEVFALLSSPDADPQKKKDAVLLIQQSCAIAKNLQAPARASLYQNLINYGLFSTITFALKHQDAAVRVAGTDILVAVIDHDALMMRNNVIKAIKEKTKPMTETLIELLLVETDLGVKAQIADAIKVLLDPNANGPSADRPLPQENNFLSKLRSNSNSVGEVDNFLQHFYENTAHTLFQPLRDLGQRESFENLTIHEVTTLSHLVEILCFFIRQHNYRGKYYLLHNNFHSLVARLLSCPEKHLKLTAIKYFRTVISMHDEYHNRQIMTFRFFGDILKIITSTMPRDNLLNSACLELFEFIRRENLKQLIVHLAETYQDTLQTITYVDTFQGILLKYEQHMNPPPPEASQDPVDSSFMTSDADTPNTRHVTINGGGTRWQGLRDTDAEQDAYFEDDDEDELAAEHPAAAALPNGLAASPIGKPLVDYGDEDDDEPPLDKESSPAKDDVISSPSTTLSPTPGTTPPSITSSATSPPANASTSPVPSSRPPPAKRLRDDSDSDDDELSRISLGAKHRHSSASSRASSVDARSNHQEPVKSPAELDARHVDGTDWEIVDPKEAEIDDAGVEDAENAPPEEPTEQAEKEKEKQKPSKHAKSTAPTRTSLRRASKDNAPAGGTAQSRKISISLGGKKDG